MSSKNKRSPSRKLVSRRRYTLVLAILICLIGIGGMVFTAISVDRSNKQSLMRRVSTIADAVPVDKVKALSADESDLENPAYLDLKDLLTRIRDDNQDVRFIYLMGMRGDSVYFNVDSENPDSEDYSPPGQDYFEASEALSNSFVYGYRFIEGPSRDRWGVWMSALAPVKDPETGQVIAVAGMDIPAFNHYGLIGLRLLIPMLVTAVAVMVIIYQFRLHRQELEIANLKQRLVSIAGHELRSPLTGLLWAVQSLMRAKDPKPTTNQLKLLNNMHSSAEASLSTVNHILDLSVFERRKVNKKSFTFVDLKSMLEEVVKKLDLAAEEKQVSIKFVGTWPDQLNTHADPNALKRALSNIVSNAIKYSHKRGNVELAYRAEKNDHIISVADHGIGIPKDEQKDVLAGFYRAGNANKVAADGSGFGLYVTRLIIEKHDGRLWLESEENQGTTVFVALPIFEA